MDLTLLLAIAAIALAALNAAGLLVWRPKVDRTAALHRARAKDREVLWGWRIDACERRLTRTLEAHGISPLEEDEAEPSKRVVDAAEALGVEL